MKNPESPIQFQEVEDDPNIEVIIFEHGERYLMRSLDPDSPTETWTYHRKGESPKVVYSGGILPSTLVPKIAYLTMEGFEYPFPSKSEIMTRVMN